MFRPLPVLLLCAAAAAPASAEVSDRVARTYPLAAGALISVEITVGTVQVRAWDRPAAAVEIVRRAPDAAALAAMPIDVAAADGLAVRVVQRDDGRDPALRTDVVLQVPAAVTVRELRVFEGRVELAGLRGSVTAHVERGGITGTGLAGAIRLETAMGAIALDEATLTPGGVIRLRTFNGDVTVGLAAPPENARILALSMGGSITSDIPLTMRDRWGPRFGEATLGSGEPVLSIDVVNGNVAIRVPGRAR